MDRRIDAWSFFDEAITVRSQQRTFNFLLHTSLIKKARTRQDDVANFFVLMRIICLDMQIMFRAKSSKEKKDL